VNFIHSSLLVVAGFTRKGRATAALSVCRPRQARTTSRPSGLPLPPNTHAAPAPCQGKTDSVPFSFPCYSSELERPRHGRALAMAGVLRMRCPWPRSQALAAWCHPKWARAGAHGCVLCVCGEKGMALHHSRLGVQRRPRRRHSRKENRAESEAGKTRAHRGVDGERVVELGDSVQWSRVAVPCSPQRGRATVSSPLTPVTRAAPASFATRVAPIFRPPSFSPLLLRTGVVNGLPLGGGGVVEMGLWLLELLFYSQPRPWQGQTVDPRGWTRGG
jgi:hypothetical protein